jgi:para-nitrobenzyl esterase
VVPRDPFDPDAPAISAEVPMIIGSCLEDQALGMTDWDIDEAGLKNWIDAQLPGQAGKILAAYRKLCPAKRPFLIKAMIASDRAVRRNAALQAERKTAQGRAKAYLYRWTGLVRGPAANSAPSMARTCRCLLPTPTPMSAPIRPRRG